MSTQVLKQTLTWHKRGEGTGAESKVARVHCQLPTCPAPPSWPTWAPGAVHSLVGAGLVKGFPCTFFRALMQQEALPQKGLPAKKWKALGSPSGEQPGEICAPAGLILKPFLFQSTLWGTLAWFMV